jgi:tetratricopeptide (TPR) repeat protein
MRIQTATCLGWLLLLATGSLGAGPQRTFTLAGRVVQNDGKTFRGVTPIVFLQNPQNPFTAQTLADADGKFQFKNLLPGMYSLIIHIPRIGEQNKTIEIGPSFADKNGQVAVRMIFARKPQTLAKTVSTAELGLPAGAKTEYGKAHSCLEHSDTAGAITHLKKAVELAPRFSAALNVLGTIAYQTRNFAEAERYFRQALESEPDSYPPLVNLGGALLSQGKWQESLTYNLQAVNTQPDDALGQSQLGQSYFALGQLDAAEVALKSSKALDSGHFSYPQLVLAAIYMRKHNPELAIREMEEFLMLHPDSDRAPTIRNVLQDLRRKMPQAHWRNFREER